MKIVYLDQNKWIDLARAYHGRTTDRGYKAVLDFAISEVQKGTVVFPLSAIHYMEIARIRDAKRRARLGTIMWEISAGNTIASYHAILVHELETALSRRFPHVRRRPFKLLSRGVAHAFGMDRPDYEIPKPYRQQLPPEMVQGFERGAQAMMEKSALTGSGPGGVTMSPFGVTPQNHAFKQHLETLYSDITKLPREQWDDALVAISLLDIQGPLGEVLTNHGLTLAELTRGGKEALRSLAEDLPSRRADLQLHRQVLKNPTLKPKITDLEDWAGLGPATAYSDVVCCEKHFANLLLRDGFQPAATIITDIRGLPESL